MATTPGGTSMEDIIEDLQLHQALLQSLMDSRPDATDEKEEIQQLIKELERRLRHARGELSRPVSSRSSTSMIPHLDGPSDENEDSPPFWGGLYENDTTQTPLDSSPSRRSHDSALYADLSRFPQSLPSRKRTYPFADLGGPSESSSKRISSRESLPSTPSSSSADSMGDRTSALNDSTEELQRLLGFDSRDSLLTMQREQMQAEKWLRERKEQERRDAEFARTLQEGWLEPSRPSTTSSLSGLGYVGPLGSGTSPTGYVADHPASSTNVYQSALPNFAPAPYLLSHPPPSSSFPQSFVHYQQKPPIVSLQDSSDSEVSEITPMDFRRSVPRTSMGPPSRHNTGLVDDAMALAGDRTASPSTFQRSLGAPSSAYSAYPISSQSSSTLNAPSVYQTTMDKLKAGTDMLQNAGKSPYNSFPNTDPLSLINGPYADSSKTPYPWLPWDSYDMPGGDYLDGKKTTEEIKELLEHLRADNDVPKESREGTPEALKFSLLEHQKLGLTWMKQMEEGRNKGGILADDMGLGKTIQALALMVSRPSSDRSRKSNLIIAPVALMQQWKREIERMVKPKHKLSIYVLHGDKRAVTWTKLRQYDVVLTTFGTLASELKRREQWEERQRHAGNSATNIVAEAAGLPILGPNSTWYRVIIDEAQCIKNRNTKAAMGCCAINSIYRWCMSGTPMMNNVLELHSLLKFLRITPYCSLEAFNRDFTRPLKVQSESVQSKALQQLQVLLKAVLLRRTKTSKIDGKPILQLPPRVTEKVHAIFSDDEQELYKSLETQTQVQFNRYLEAGTVGRNYSNILVLLLRLRQACCHPHLIKDLSMSTEVSAVTGETETDLLENAKQFGSEVVQRLRENEPLECPICIDAVENPIIFFPCGHSTCVECFARISDPALAIQQGNNDGHVEVKCPNCRAKVDPKKVTDNVSFKKIHFGQDDAANEEKANVDDDVEEDDDDSDEEDSDSDSYSGDTASLSEFIVPDDYNDDNLDEPAGSSQPKEKKCKKTKGKGPMKPRKTLAVLKREAQRNMAAKRRYLNRLQKTWITSAKVDKALEVLHETEGRGEGEKTIIFSQFTSLLDLLEIPIARKGWNYRRYDGSMKPGDRNNAVTDFTENPDCKIMLVSLKAGNSGLNLVAASQVIIFDPFWNPYIEEQAIDRAHRIGQMRPVRVHRILVQNTVEDRILQLQDQKRALIEGALDENAGKKISRLGLRELKFLFSIS